MSGEELPPQEPAPESELQPDAVPSEGAPEAASEPAEEPSKKHWYVVKVQSGREESIKEAIEKRMRIEGLEEFFGEIRVPTEKVTEMRNGKRVTKERKLYPGYLMCNVEFNDRILYLFRETSGVGDFVGGGLHHPPPPMSPNEVQRMIGAQQDKGVVIQTKPKFDRGDRVKVKDGVFSGMDGEVKELIEAKGLVKVEVTIFGRPVSIDLEYWQVEPL